MYTTTFLFFLRIHRLGAKIWNFWSILFYFTACNVGDEGGFAPNIQDNKEGNFSFVEKLSQSKKYLFSHTNYIQLKVEIVWLCILNGGCMMIARWIIPRKKRLLQPKNLENEFREDIRYQKIMQLERVECFRDVCE